MRILVSSDRKILAVNNTIRNGSLMWLSRCLYTFLLQRTSAIYIISLFLAPLTVRRMSWWCSSCQAPYPSRPPPDTMTTKKESRCASLANLVQPMLLHMLSISNMTSSRTVEPVYSYTKPRQRTHLTFSVVRNSSFAVKGEACTTLSSEAQHTSQWGSDLAKEKRSIGVIDLNAQAQ